MGPEEVASNAGSTAEPAPTPTLEQRVATLEAHLGAVSKRAWMTESVLDRARAEIAKGNGDLRAIFGVVA